VSTRSELDSDPTTPDLAQPSLPAPDPKRRRFQIKLTASQWTILILMAGVFLAIVGAVIWVLRTGYLEQSVDVLATAAAGPTPTQTPSGLVVDALATPTGLYWPAEAQPLATPNAPSDLLWWDSRFAYRREIRFDTVTTDLPAGMWARVLLDGEGLHREGKVRPDGADVRVLAWDGGRWWPLPTSLVAQVGKRGWNVIFALQSADLLRRGHYYVYYGNPYASPVPDSQGAGDSSRLLLSLGEEEGVEWGPQVLWMAHSTATQTIVSPDGRIVIESPAGALAQDVQVRLRTVPVGEKNSYGALPNFELHVDPPPVPLGTNNIVYWRPPLTIVINWVGLPVTPEDLSVWTYFVYAEDTASWYPIPVEFDPERGLIWFETEQL